MVNLNLPEKRAFVGPASLWKRIVAFMLDLFLIDLFITGFFRDITTHLVGSTTGLVATYAFLNDSTAVVTSLTMILIMILSLAIAYFVLMQYIAGQTIGCMLVNIHVVKQGSDKDLLKPGLWQCILRNIFIIPTVPFILLWVADPVYYFLTRKGQRLTEMASNTKVVERFEF
ncbi:MAG: RDD family protein [Candidatus Woesearchaeota archaeon]